MKTTTLPVLLALWIFGPAGFCEAQEQEGFVPLFDGKTFHGWRYLPAFEGHWVVRDGVIHCDGKVPVKRGEERNLWTEKEYADFVLVVEWRLPGEVEVKPMNVFSPDGHILRDDDGRPVRREMPHAGDSGVYLRGSSKAQVNIWSQPMGSGDINSYHKDLSLPLEVRRACMPKTNADRPFGQWNRFEITMVGDRVTVVLGGQKVIDDAQLPDVPERGPIALQNHSDPVEFRNLRIQELD